MVELVDGTVISTVDLQSTKYQGSVIDANNEKAMAAMASVFAVSGLDNITVDALVK